MVTFLCLAAIFLYSALAFAVEQLLGVRPGKHLITF